MAPKTQFKKTLNQRGCMHPLNNFSLKFISLTHNKEAIDLGPAFGNVVHAAIEKGVAKIHACDLDNDHLRIIRESTPNNLQAHLETHQGQFPHEFSFTNNSIDIIYSSHLFEYLNGDEVEIGIEKCFQWLKKGGKFFLCVYSIYIHELNHEKFNQEYKQRKAHAVAWPGYFENYNNYCIDSDSIPSDELFEFTPHLHLFELDILKSALERAGFIVDKADYLDGESNGAVEETWLDGRELIGIIARKP